MSEIKMTAGEFADLFYLDLEEDLAVAPNVSVTILSDGTVNAPAHGRIVCVARLQAEDLERVRAAR